MMAVPFDTLKLVERLEQAGVPPEQAKVQAAVLAEVIAAEDERITERAAERFAGKVDVEQRLMSIEAEVKEVRSDIKALRSEMKQGSAELKSELIKWVVSVGILQMALIAGLVLKLGH